MSRDPLHRLLGNLQTTRQVYSELLAVAERKQKNIMENDIEGLRKDLDTEERLAGQGARLNSDRTELHRLCQKRLGVGKDAETLEALCRLMPPDWRDKFRTEREDLLQTQRRLHSINKMNVALVNSCLELMEGLLAALFDLEPISAYGPRGIRKKAELPARSLDTRA